MAGEEGAHPVAHLALASDQQVAARVADEELGAGDAAAACRAAGSVLKRSSRAETISEGAAIFSSGSLASPAGQGLDAAQSPAIARRGDGR